MRNEFNHTPVADRHPLRRSGRAAREIHIERSCVRHPPPDPGKDIGERLQLLRPRHTLCLFLRSCRICRFFRFRPGDHRIHGFSFFFAVLSQNFLRLLQQVFQDNPFPGESKLRRLCGILFIRDQNRGLQHVHDLLRPCRGLPHINKAVETARIDGAEHRGHRVHGFLQIKGHRAFHRHILRQKLSHCSCLPDQLPKGNVLLRISKRRAVRKALRRLLQEFQNVMNVSAQNFLHAAAVLCLLPQLMLFCPKPQHTALPASFR